MMLKNSADSSPVYLRLRFGSVVKAPHRTRNCPSERKIYLGKEKTKDSLIFIFKSMDDLDETNIILLKCPGKSKDVAQICTSTVHVKE